MVFYLTGNVYSFPGISSIFRVKEMINSKLLWFSQRDEINLGQGGYWLLNIYLAELGGRVCVASFVSASALCLSRPSFASFASFAHPTGMHSVDAMREDTTVLKKTRTSKTRMQKTRNGHERRNLDANFRLF